MTLDDLLRWAQLANLVIIPVGGYLVWLFRRGLITEAALAEALKARDEKVGDLGTEVDRLKNRLDTLPTAQAFSELNTEVAKISTSTGHMKTDIEGLKKSIDRLSAFLMSGGGSGNK